MVLPRTNPETNCFKCKHYNPSTYEQYRGFCTRKHPTAKSGVGTASPPEQQFPYLMVPSETTCGQFERWFGPAREEGVCPYSPPGE